MIIKSLIPKFFYLFIVLSLTLPLNSCSDDDDDEGQSSNTFLEKNDGKSWVETTDFETVYLRLNNNTNNFLDVWNSSEDENCYYYNDDIFEGGAVKIIENSSDKLIVEVVYQDGNKETYTFSLQGDKLKVVIDEIYDGETDQYILYFDSASINLDNLNMCDS